MEAEMQILGLGFVLLGFIMSMSSINALANIRTDQAMCRFLGKEYKTSSKVILVYLWHYSGWFFTAIGGALIGQIFI